LSESEKLLIDFFDNLSALVDNTQFTIHFQVQLMENGDDGAIGVNVQQNMLGAFRAVTEFVTVQRQNTMENIAR
jgi:hypothetical protein